MGWFDGVIEDFTGLDVSNSSAADRALAAQKGAATDANATQLKMYNQTRDDLNPYRDAGSGAVSDLAGNKFMDNWNGDPGYQFRMQQGVNALQNSAAAKGGLGSGATLKALSKYGQDYASNEYGNAYGREFSRLSNLANLGENAAAQTGAFGQSYANAYGNNVTGAANAEAAKAMAQSGQTTSLINSGISAYAGMPPSGSSKPAQNPAANFQGSNYFAGDGPNQLAYCDERLKTDIEPVDPRELAELRMTIMPYHYKYVAEEYGTGDWVGVMAQDLQKSKLGRSVVFTDEQGHLRVDMPKLLALLVATFAVEAA